MTEPDAEKIRSEHWPLHGPYSPERTRAAGDTIYELVRYLNYATGQGAAKALPHPAALYGLVGNLKAAAGGLEQTLLQTSSVLNAMATNPALRHADYRDDPGIAEGAASDAAERLLDAHTAVGDLYENLNQAHSLLSSLYLQDRGDE